MHVALSDKTIHNTVEIAITERFTYVYINENHH